MENRLSRSCMRKVIKELFIEQQLMALFLFNLGEVVVDAVSNGEEFVKIMQPKIGQGEHAKALIFEEKGESGGNIIISPALAIDYQPLIIALRSDFDGERKHENRLTFWKIEKYLFYCYIKIFFIVWVVL